MLVGALGWSVQSLSRRRGCIWTIPRTGFKAQSRKAYGLGVCDVVQSLSRLR